MSVEIEELAAGIIAWHTHHMEQLNLIVDNKDSRVVFKSDDDEEIELPKEMEPAFRFGVQYAMSKFEKLPFSVEEDDEDIT